MSTRHHYSDRDTKYRKTRTPNQIETQSNRNWSTTHPNATEQTLTQEDKTNAEKVKRTMFKKKTTLTSLRNQDWKTVKAETEKNIIKYLIEQNHEIKGTDLCWSKISLY